MNKPFLVSFRISVARVQVDDGATLEDLSPRPVSVAKGLPVERATKITEIRKETTDDD